MLVQEHRQVQALLDELRGALHGPDLDAKACIGLFEQLDRELTSHARAEEAVVYPAFLAATEASGQVHEAFEEHAMLEHLLAQLRTPRSIDEHWAAKIEVLATLVVHHVDDEEGRQFDAVRDAFSPSEAEEMAERFAEAKAHVVAAQQPCGPVPVPIVPADAVWRPDRERQVLPEGQASASRPAARAR